MKTLFFQAIFLFFAVNVLAQQTMTPGFQFLGKGYDAFFGNLYDTSGNGDPGWRENVFEFTTNQNRKTPDNLWVVPDYTTSTMLSACSVEQTEKLLNDGFDYQNQVTLGFGIDLELFGASFQFSIDSKHITKTTIDEESIYAIMESTCAAYQLNMNAYLTPNITDDFRYGVDTLTDVYDETAYMTFIQTFGTHYIRELRLGGRWGWLIEFKRKSFQKMLDDSINWNIGLSYAGKVKAGFNLNGSTETNTVTTVMNSISHNFTFNIGGDYHPDSDTWMSSIRANPMPINIQAIPIWNLLISKYFPTVANLNGKKTLLMNATLNYCSWLHNNIDSTVNCTRPAPLPKPQPKPIDPNAIRGICVHNNGGYALSWKLYNDNHQNLYAQSDVFTAGNYRCLDGLQVQAMAGDHLSCGLVITAGLNNYRSCDTAKNIFNPMSTLSANYICGGSTLNPYCQFDGYSQ